MLISSHYNPIADKTLLVATDHEKARFFSAWQREVEEVEGIVLTGPGSDDLREQHLEKLYMKIIAKVQKDMKESGYTHVILCVPEINRPTLLKVFERSYPKFADAIEKKIVHMVPKNLASMNLAQILRIILEDRR